MSEVLFVEMPPEVKPEYSLGFAQGYSAASHGQPQDAAEGGEYFRAGHRDGWAAAHYWGGVDALAVQGHERESGQADVLAR